MTARWLSAIGVVAIAFAAAAGAQRSSAVPATPVATGLILGRVVDAESGQPLAGAIVTLTPNVAPMAPSPQRQPQSAATDREGRFVFGQLPQGAYQCAARTGGNGNSPGGFISTGFGFPIGSHLDAGYGQTRPDGPMKTIDLAEGQKLADIFIRLWKGATLDGSVFDEAGDPQVATVVSAVRRNADGRLMTGPTTRTDDRGAFHFGTLMPGEYVIVVPQTQTSVPSSLLQSPVDPQLRAQIAPRLSATNAPPGLLGGMTTGVTIGSSRVLTERTSTVDKNASAPVAGRSDLFVYQTTFYPAATSLKEAQVIRVAVGEERSGLALHLQPTRGVEVSGVLTDSAGPVQQFGVHLLPPDARDGASLLEVAGTMTDGEGRFSFPVVPVGQYTLLAQRGQPVVGTRGGGASPYAPAPTRVADETGAWASQAVSVGDRNVTGVALILREGVRISGRMEFQGSSPQPDAARLAQPPVVIRRETPLFRAAFAEDRGAQIDATGHFTAAGIPPGRYIIDPRWSRVAALWAPWSVQSIAIGAREVGDAVVTIGDRDVTDVVITFTEPPRPCRAGDSSIARS